MPITVGRAVRAGVRREAITSATLWPASTAGPVTTLLPLLGVQQNLGPQKAGSETTHNQYGPVAYDLVNVAPRLALPLQARYQGLEALWACALGHMAWRISGNLMPQTLVAGAYRHLYEVDARLGNTQGWTLGDGMQVGDGWTLNQRKVRRLTAAVDYAWGSVELLSAMVTGWTLSSDHGGVTLALDLASHSVSTTSTVNTTTTLRALAPSTASRLLHTQLAFRIAPYSAVTPLGGGDVVQVVSWALRVDNHLATAFSARMGLAPEEYERTQAPTVTLTFVLGRNEASTWHTRWPSNTILMADAKWTGGAIGATGHNYQCNLYFPGLQVSNVTTNIDGPGVQGLVIQCLGVVPTAAAAGFPTMGHLGPVAAELVNGSSVNPLTAT